jgi:hypothetical protein
LTVTSTVATLEAFEGVAMVRDGTTTAVENSDGRRDVDATEGRA